MQNTMNTTLTSVENIKKGTPCLVRNDVSEPWKIKIYDTWDCSTGSKYQNARPFKVSNYVGANQHFSFKFCKTLPIIHEPLI